MKSKTTKQIKDKKVSASLTKRLWEVWYYLSIVISAWVFFIFLNNSPCFWENSQRCASYSKVSDIFVIVSIALANLLFARRKYKGSLHIPKFSWWTGWSGDRTLPPSFVIFIMMAAVFIGEVLPVVVSILIGNFGAYGSKEPIIKTLSDFELILVIYSILGTLFWALYRYINWRIVAVFAFVLTFLLERYVYWHPEGEISPANTISFGVILGGIIVYFLVLVLPYLLFQKARHEWGEHVIVKVLILVLLLNIIGLGFTYYYLINTGWYEKHSSGEFGVLVQPGNTDKTYANLSMITPYVNENDISRIGPFGDNENNPWGFRHQGINFMTDLDLIPIQAVTDGIIEKLDSSKENEQQGWHTELCINHRPFLVCYNFETFSADDSDGQKQSANIFVKNGDIIKQGDLIGKLVHRGDGAHVDLGILQMDISGERICPEPYFTEEARTSILRLLHKDHPDWNMCY